MNNLSSYFGLVDAKIRASDKDLPVSCCKKRQKSPGQETGFGNSSVSRNGESHNYKDCFNYLISGKWSSVLLDTDSILRVKPMYKSVK